MTVILKNSYYSCIYLTEFSSTASLAVPTGHKLLYDLPQCANISIKYGLKKASHYYKATLADSSDFGLPGEQSSQNWRFPALNADETPCKI